MSLENEKGEMLTSEESDQVSLWGVHYSKLQKAWESGDQIRANKKTTKIQAKKEE